MAVVVVFPLLLLLLAVLTQLAASGVLRKNWIAGIRIRSTLRSSSAWVAGHKAAAPWVWTGLAVAAVAAAAALLLNGTIAATFAAIVVIVFAATVVVSLALAGRAARAANVSTLSTS